MKRPIEITVQIDDVKLETRGAYGHDIALIDFIQNGKRVTAHLNLFQMGHHKNPTLRLTVVNRGDDVTKMVRIRPWTDDTDYSVKRPG